MFENDAMNNKKSLLADRCHEENNAHIDYFMWRLHMPSEKPFPFPNRGGKNVKFPPCYEILPRDILKQCLQRYTESRLPYKIHPVTTDPEWLKYFSELSDE